MHIYVHIHIYIYICMCTYIYKYLHNSCMCTYATVQQLLWHGSYCELVWSLARTSCRLSFPPALLPLRRVGRPPASPLFANTFKFKLAAAVVLYKHHPIIRVGAGLIQFVYGSHSRMAVGPHPRQKSIFAHFCGLHYTSQALNGRRQK